MVSDRLPARGIPHRCFDARGRLVHSPAHDPIEPNTDLEKLRDVGYCLVPGGLDPDLRGRLNDLLESLPPRDGRGERLAKLGGWQRAMAELSRVRGRSG